jgi:hypothetical protein
MKSKSIITNDDECFIHKNFYDLETQGTERHHCIHGYANRKLADEDGLTVMLCNWCHRNLHDKGWYDKELQKIAQEKWMEHNNKSIEDFIKRYGKNFI